MYIQLRRIFRLLAHALQGRGNILRKRLLDERGVETTFLWWIYLRAVFHRGYVLTSGLYFVVDAHLSAEEIIFLGTIMSVTLVLSGVPTGVWSDAIGRKLPLVIGQIVLAAGMVMTGVVTAFPLIVVTQVLWALGWAFLTGADVAWITDELDQPHRIDRVLTASASWELAGGMTGMVVFGMLGWTTGLATAIIVSGIGMGVLGLFVAARFPERGFIPIRENRLRASLSIFRLGARLSRRDSQILLVCVATMLFNGAAIVFWLFPRQLVNLGLSEDSVLWYTVLGIVSSAAGVVALRIVQARIEGVGAARHSYALACFIGALGLIVLNYAPDALIGGAGVLLVSGIAGNVTRTVGVIWVNRRTTSDVRATVHSFLDLAESIGEICGGFVFVIIAGTAGISITLITSATLIAFAGVIVALLGRAGSDPG